MHSATSDNTTSEIQHEINTKKCKRIPIAEKNLACFIETNACSSSGTVD